MSDGAMGLKTPVHFCEIDGALALVDLDGIPTAQRDVRTALAREMNKFVFAAGTASRAGLGSGNLGVLIGPDIK